MLFKITQNTILVIILIQNIVQSALIEQKNDAPRAHRRILNEAGNILLPITGNKTLKNLKRDFNFFEQNAGELCNRECQPEDRRICYFRFELEHYQAMGVACGDCEKGVESDCNNPQCILGDGFEKGVMSINRQIPGPAIQVCHGDLIVVDVVNLSGGTAATIHWHGLHMRDTPWMDGVPFVTQCPIDFSNTFRYQFYATEPGTHFYHSHSGHHKVNGQYGALIIRQPILEDKQSQYYDYDLPEHHILISDWMHRYGEDLFPGIPSLGGIFPDSVLINGRGSYINPKNLTRKSVPPTRYYVKSGKRYRFRIINSISHACPFQIQIQNHSLEIIASDSYNLEPRSIETLVTNSGERYDFVLETNQLRGDYWIRVRGLGVCSKTDSMALLRYQDNDLILDENMELALPSMPNYEDKFSNGAFLNHPNASCFADDNNYCITELQAMEEDIPLLFSPPDYKFYLAFNNYVVPNKDIFCPGGYHHFLNLVKNLTVIGALNQISLVFPPSPPLTQPEDIDYSLYCDEFNTPKHCTKGKICPCVHRLQVPTGSIVELTVVDESRAPGRLHHPFHLHGQPFLVTGLEQERPGQQYTADMVRRMDFQRTSPRRLLNVHPPWKDTVSIPSYGYVVLRFRADNPGYWLMHCHYEWHLAVGMGLIFQVGDNSEMVPPPEGFPKCGNFIPDIMPLS